MKTINIVLNENDKIIEVNVNDVNNHVVHLFNEEDNEEKEAYYNMSVKGFINEYLEYYRNNKEGEK